MAQAHSSSTTVNKSQLEVPVDIRSRFRLSNDESPRKLSEEVSERISKAYAKADDLQQKLDEKILSALASLDELEDDDLLSTDWESLDNHFETIQRTLDSSFEFRMPAIWTKKYAGSLLPDSERVRSYSVPKKVVPVYSFNSQELDVQNSNIELGSSPSESYLDHVPEMSSQGHVSLLRVTGVMEQPHVRRVKSLNDITAIEERFSDGGDPMIQTNSFPNLTIKSDLKQYLSGVVSSHFDLGNRALELFQDDIEVAHIPHPTSIKSDIQRSFLKHLNDIDKDITPLNLSKMLPKVADKLVSHSKRRCSEGTQTTKKEQSAFQHYVELKRQLSAAQKSATGLETFHKQFKKLKFLKDITIEEYTTYKQSVAMTPSQAIGLVSKTPLMKKNNAKLLNTLGLKDETSVTAASPSYSSLSLCSKPSRKFQHLKQFVHDKRIAKNPSILLPTADVSSNFPQLQQVYVLPVSDVEDSGAQRLRVPESYGVLVDKTSTYGLEEGQLPGLNDILRNARSVLSTGTSPTSQFYSGGHAIHNTSGSSLQRLAGRRVISYHHVKAPAGSKPIILPKRFLPDSNFREPLTHSTDRKLSPTHRPATVHSETLAVLRSNKELHQLPKSEPHLVLNSHIGTRRLHPVADSKHMLALTARYFGHDINTSFK